MNNLPFVLCACFVLHNYCEVNKEPVNEQSINAALQYDKDFQPPSSACNVRAENNKT